MSESAPIVLRNAERIQIELSEPIRAQVAQALKDCREITTIADPLDFDAAVSAQRAASTLTRSLDNQRKEVTRPLDEAKAKCIEIVRELTDPLEAEAKRLAGLNAAYEAERRRKAEDEARKIREEQMRAEREAAEKAAAERRRIEEEMRAKAAQANAEERRRLEAEAAEARRLADERAAEQAEQARAKAALQASQAASAAPTGATLLKTPAYEITDIKALYEVRPEWFELRPRDGVIKAALRQIDESTTIPGLRHWKDTKLSTR